jgi:hypothetical protein
MSTADSERKDWRYKVRDCDPVKVKQVIEELTEEDDELIIIDIEDEYDCDVKSVHIFSDDKEKTVSFGDDKFHIDYRTLTFTLPPTVSSVFDLPEGSLSAKQIRYCNLPSACYDSCDVGTNLVILSVWNTNRDIIKIHLVTESPRSSAILLNAITRLLYESCGKNATRTHKFCLLGDGPIDVAFCTADERDLRDVQKQKRDETAKKTAADDSEQIANEVELEKKEEEVEEVPALPRTAMFLSFDEEALCLYEDMFAAAPLHDFRFYREQTARSVDTIFVCNTEDQLELQQGDRVFYVCPIGAKEQSVKAYKELVDKFVPVLLNRSRKRLSRDLVKTTRISSRSRRPGR